MDKKWKLGNEGIYYNGQLCSYLYVVAKLNELEEEYNVTHKAFRQSEEYLEKKYNSFLNALEWCDREGMNYPPGSPLAESGYTACLLRIREALDTREFNS